MQKKAYLGRVEHASVHVNLTKIKIKIKINKK
jgi:hypothetical protein